MNKIAIFASGSGSNARKIMEYAAANASYEVALVVSNRPDAGVLDIARMHGIPTLVIDRAGFRDCVELVATLREKEVGHVVLAGFLWLVPAALLAAFPDRIVNIHPSLLPKYGGKGMYGHHVHEAVKAAGETESGMTIHVVNADYDKGKVLFQARCEVLPTDSAEDIGRRVLALEHAHYPRVIADWMAQTV
jgi:phosphoribosylglycinamide formyltransferase 1